MIKLRLRLIPRRQAHEPAIIGERIFETSWIRALALLNDAMHDQINDCAAYEVLRAALQNVKREYFATYPPPRPTE